MNTSEDSSLTTPTSNEGPARGAGPSAFGFAAEVAGGGSEPCLPARDDRRAQLVTLLEHGQHLGFLGPGPVERALEHALAHGEAAQVARATPRRIVDLGAGGGVPGLVLAALWPQHQYVLVDAMHKRTDFLAEAAASLSLANVEVVNGRGEQVARTQAETAHLVVARGFGPPPVTAEIAARILADDGHLIVSAGPETLPVWQAGDLGLLGLGSLIALEVDGYHFVTMQKLQQTPERFPRRSGMPAKRPLW